MLSVVFFRTAAGNEPVLDWLRDLAVDDRRILGEDLRTVQIGWPIGMPLCRSLGAGLYEVRSDITDKRIARLIFFQSGDGIVIVEGVHQENPGDAKGCARSGTKEEGRIRAGRAGPQEADEEALKAGT